MKKEIISRLHNSFELAVNKVCLLLTAEEDLKKIERKVKSEDKMLLKETKKLKKK
jgi:hypothetical protein